MRRVRRGVVWKTRLERFDPLFYVSCHDTEFGRDRTTRWSWLSHACTRIDRLSVLSLRTLLKAQVASQSDRCAVGLVSGTGLTRWSNEFVRRGWCYVVIAHPETSIRSGDLGMPVTAFSVRPDRAIERCWLCNR